MELESDGQLYADAQGYEGSGAHLGPVFDSTCVQNPRGQAPRRRVCNGVEELPLRLALLELRRQVLRRRRVEDREKGEQPGDVHGACLHRPSRRLPAVVVAAMVLSERSSCVRTDSMRASYLLL